MSTKAPPFTMTNESITVIWEGKSNVVQKGSPHFSALRKAIIDEDWEAVPKNLTVTRSIQEWAKGEFTWNGNTFLYKGETIPNNIHQRMVKMATAGEDPTPLFKFWERLSKNPSYRSVNQLWDFLQNKGIPLTPDGCFLAYKSVRNDYKDVHSGTFDNSPGKTNEMPRNQISDDPKVECHEGFHVGALEYARTFHSGGRIVVCKVDPEHVVSVPYDHSSQKMRVCKYKVEGHHNGSHLPETTFKEDSYADDDDHDDQDDLVKGDEPGGNEEPDYDPEDDAASAGSLTRVADALGYDGSQEDGGLAKAEAEEKKLIASEKRAPKKGFTKLDKLDMQGLLEQSIDVLRKYATKGMQITGASKIPGGKVALVSKILEVRK